MTHSSSKTPNHVSLIVFALVVLSLLLSACGAKPVAAAEVPPTLPAPSATPLPPTETPAPTATFTPPPTPTKTATPNARATAHAAQTATAIAYYDAEVKPQLVEIGINPEDGHLLGRLESPVFLMVDRWNTEVYTTLDDLGQVGDFVAQFTVEWDSTSGLAGCSINFRAEEDNDNGAHYTFQMMRLQNAPAWDIEYHKFGKYQSTLTGKTIFSGHLNDEKDSQNVVTLIAKGGEVRTYLNGEKENAVVNYDKLKTGLIRLMVWQESGETSCTYTGGWVWVFDK